MSDRTDLIKQAREYERRGMDGIPVGEGPQVIALLAALADALAQPAPLTIDRDALFEAIVDRLSEHGGAHNEFDPSDEPTTCITLRRLPVESLAEFITTAVIAHLSTQPSSVPEIPDNSNPAQPVEGEVTRTVWHKDQFWVNIETDAEGLVTISDELLVKLMTESGWVVQPCPRASGR